MLFMHCVLFRRMCRYAFRSYSKPNSIGLICQMKMQSEFLFKVDAVANACKTRNS